MACCPKEKKYGYEDSRFEKDVDENFHCSICYNVLKEPRTCRNNEHIFCDACIREHLNVNSQTCPECNEHLTIDTLRRPRVVNNYLSKLKINCDHAGRGCPQFTCLEELETHVASCGYAPAWCSNAECGMEINKQDKVHHETEVCEYRRVKCHDCAQIQEDVGLLKGSLSVLEGKVETGNEKVEASREETKEVKKEVKEVKKEVKEVKKEVEDLKDNLSRVNKNVDEVKVMIAQVLEHLNRREPPFPTPGMLSTPREDILIAGGYGRGYASVEVEKNTEIFSWEKNGWFKVSSMNESHHGASSCIYKDQVFVVGGQETAAIDTLDLNKLPLKWKKFPGELPYECDDHQTVVYQQSVIHIGGFRYDDDDDDGGGRSNLISELHLASPCVMKPLCQMPEARDCHSAEVFDDRVLIVGGYNDSGKTLDSVLEFDPKTNKCKVMPKLPAALKRMATVRRNDEVVVIGGRNDDDQSRNDVFMYNCKTGMITALPSMLEKRYNCCAVITRNTIVVMGGVNEKGERLNTVECFTMGSSAWKYLPAMNRARAKAVAEVLPCGRKYV